VSVIELSSFCRNKSTTKKTTGTLSVDNRKVLVEIIESVKESCADFSLALNRIRPKPYFAGR
jgi:hypothetical protein